MEVWWLQMRHSPFKKLEISERGRDRGRSRMKRRVDRFVNLVEKKEARERERGEEAGGIWTLQNI
ncbi:hypothetical protein YC2023_019878 [Brassica napus]